MCKYHDIDPILSDWAEKNNIVWLTDYQDSVVRIGMFKIDMVGSAMFIAGEEQAGGSMKNVQVIDDADNCAYEIFALPEAHFGLMFPNNQDVEFADTFLKRLGKKKAQVILEGMWNRPQEKKQIVGLHGTLFYGLAKKRSSILRKKNKK